MLIQQKSVGKQVSANINPQLTFGNYTLYF